MAEKNRDIIKGYFQAGYKPTEDQFEDFIDSTLNKTEDEIHVDAAKNVGIGTDKPQAKLDVTGAIAIHGNQVIDQTGKWVGESSGLKGDKGEQGLKGLKGDTGDQGIQGSQGLQGAKGDTGEQGIQGSKGDKGDTGPQGSDGTAAGSLWNETANVLHTSKKVGISTDKPSTELEVKGYITQSQVAFSIEGSSSADETKLLEFETIITNELEAWNGTKHFFKPPIDGLYMFSISFNRLIKKPEDTYIPVYVCLKKNGEDIPEYKGAISYDCEFSCSTVVLKLNKSDTITAILKVHSTAKPDAKFLKSYSLTGFRL